jgi:1,4-dihydroxy-2-naphthoate octaprenyltransferase
MSSQSPTVKDWLSAFRLRTLPLSFSVIALGAFTASFDGPIDALVVLMAFLTTLFLQILSNLANDYGDSEKGTDNEERTGPPRAVQSGSISLTQMRRAVVVFSGLSLLSGIVLIYLAFGPNNMLYALLFLTLGLLAIAAAIKYTVGKNAYGYRGMGDLFVFIFFGLVGVLGTYFLLNTELNPWVLLPASGMGLLSTGVLNLNNMRDIAGDKRARKITLAVMLGLKTAKAYHLLLLFGAVAFFFIFTATQMEGPWKWLWLITLPLLALNIFKTYSTSKPADLDPLLKQLALSTTALVLCFGIGGSL